MAFAIALQHILQTSEAQSQSHMKVRWRMEFWDELFGYDAYAVL